MNFPTFIPGLITSPCPGQRKISPVISVMEIAKHKTNSNRGHDASKEEATVALHSGFVPRVQSKLEYSPMQFQSASYSRTSPRRTSSPTRQSFPNERRNSMSPRHVQEQAIENTLEKEKERDSQKDTQIQELLETIELLEAKVMKLEQLIRLKDHKIQVLSGRPMRNGNT
eukprot:c2675_g2_i1 orf=394-903(+)